MGSTIRHDFILGLDINPRLCMSKDSIENYLSVLSGEDHVSRRWRVGKRSLPLSVIPLTCLVASGKKFPGLLKFLRRSSVAQFKCSYAVGKLRPSSLKCLRVLGVVHFRLGAVSVIRALKSV